MSYQETDNLAAMRLFNENTMTGEIEEVNPRDYRIITKEQEKIIADVRRKKEWIAARSDYPFVWAIYKSATVLLGEMPSTHVTMLFYLITYCRYDGILATHAQPITKETLGDVLGVSDKTAKRFWASVSEFGICFENDNGVLAVNENYFHKGKLSRKKVAEMAKRDEYATKIYIRAIRDLYSKSTAISKKTLCYMFQVIPFLHRDYNIICHNPFEKNLSHIRPMNLGELCQLIGYSEENSTRLLSSLLEPRFTTKTGEESAMRCVISDKLRDRRSYSLFVNPNVYYAGSKWDEVKVLGQF